MTGSGRTTRPSQGRQPLYAVHERAHRDTVSSPAGALSLTSANHRHASSGWGEAPLAGEVDAMLDYRVAGLREGGCHRGCAAAPGSVKSNQSRTTGVSSPGPAHQAARATTILPRSAIHVHSGRTSADADGRSCPGQARRGAGRPHGELASGRRGRRFKSGHPDQPGTTGRRRSSRTAPVPAAGIRPNHKAANTASPPRRRPARSAPGSALM
jgi:hypothetical protein